MPKVQKNFRFDEDTIMMLQKLTEAQGQLLSQEVGIKKWTMTEQIEVLILNAYREEFETKA